MAVPSEKSPAITQFLENFFGRTTAIEADLCTWCRRSATMFRDALSRAEYRISGLCQACQDEVFHEEDEEDEMEFCN